MCTWNAETIAIVCQLRKETDRPQTNNNQTSQLFIIIIIIFCLLLIYSLLSCLDVGRWRSGFRCHRCCCCCHCCWLRCSLRFIFRRLHLSLWPRHVIIKTKKRNQWHRSHFYSILQKIKTEMKSASADTLQQPIQSPYFFANDVRVCASLCTRFHICFLLPLCSSFHVSKIA